MDLVKCPICGEMYSTSYRKCPFCEEEERPRKAAAKRRGGHRVSEKKRTHSARGSAIAVVAVVLVVLSWHLFGGKLAQQSDEQQTPPVENNNADAAIDPTVDPSYDPSIADEPNVVDPDTPAPPVVEEPDDTQDEPDTPTQTVDAASLTLKTNVGALSKDQGTGKYDCSIKTTDNYIKLIVQGTDMQAAWTSADTSVVTVASDGTLKPLKAGTTTVTASVGGAQIECIVRVRSAS